MKFKERWTRHAIAVPSVTRTVDSFLRTPKGVKRIKREEMVHIHDVYREKVKGPANKILWRQGAKVGTV